MDNPRLPSDELELEFFNEGTGEGKCYSTALNWNATTSKVPVIAVLTKYEALIERAKEAFNGGLTKEQRLAFTKKNVLDPMQKSKHQPAGYVTIHGMW